MIDLKRENEIKDAINAHLEDFGPREWQKVSARFPDISRATFWRYVKNVREINQCAPEEDANWSDYEGDKILNRLPEKIDKFASQNEYPLPRQIVLLRQAQEDIELLKRSALDPQGRIRSSATYQKSITLRIKAVEMESRLLDATFNQHDRQEFYDKIIEVIGSESPEVRDKIIAALEKLNAARGK